MVELQEKKVNPSPLAINIVSGIIVGLLFLVPEELYIWFAKKLSYKWLAIFLLLIPILYYNLLYFFLKSKTNRTTLKLFYGIYWDINGNPYCPACKTPLSQTSVAIMYCSNCKTNHTARADGGGSIFVFEVKKRLKEIWKRDKLSTFHL